MRKIVLGRTENSKKNGDRKWPTGIYMNKAHIWAFWGREAKEVNLER